MKILFTILLFFLFLSCQKFIKNSNFNFVQGEAIKLKELTNFKESYVCTGSYRIKNDTVVSKFEIQSKYSLMVIKLKNASKDYKLNYYANTDCSTPGHFSIIDVPLYEVNFCPSVFKDDFKINQIDLISDKEINYQMNNDSIKSFNVKFNKYVIKINNQVDKVIYGKLENLSTNVLFYKIEDEVYLFIMTPIKKKLILEDDILYNYLFPTTQQKN